MTKEEYIIMFNNRKKPKFRWFYILPTCFFTLLFCFLDRQAISIALPGGMMKDLAINATLAGFASGIVAIGALFLQVEAGQLAQKGKAKLFMAWVIFAWSVLSLLTAFVRTAWELLIIRFFLGMAEGGMCPAVMTLITFWFSDKDGERSKANTTYFSAISVAYLIMGPLAGEIINSFGWRYLFIIIGSVGLVTLFVWEIFICERPENAKWLSWEEKEYIVTTINTEREMVKKTVGDLTVKGDQISLGLLFQNKNVWYLCIIGFCTSIGQFVFLMWLPSMVKNVTKNNIVNVGWLSTLPSIAMLLGVWTWAYITSKVKDRRLTTY
jgi:MFS family permease